MSFNSKMTAIADEIRELSGTSEAMGLDVMATTLNTENTNFNLNLTEQDDLISQIQAALLYKTTPPENNGVELPELSNEGSASDLFYGKQLIDSNGEVVTGAFSIDTEINTVDELIGQIQTALHNKAANTPVIIEPVLQDKTVTPSSVTQIVTPDADYDGLNQVTVEAIPDTYIQPVYIKEATTYIPTTIDQTIQSGTYISGDQTLKGDSNLVAENIKSGVSIFGVAGTLDISVSNTDYEDLYQKVMNRSFTEVVDVSTTAIGSYAFAGCSKLTSVSLPQVASIGNHAFYECSRLISAEFPLVTSIDKYTFAYCQSLTTVSFPVCTTVGSYAFNFCISLKETALPLVTKLNDWAFFCCSLKAANFPECTTIGSNCFASCYNLSSVSFPQVKTIRNYAFDNCLSLTSISLPECTSIGSYAFGFCYNLVSLYLQGASMCNLTNSNVFTSTPIAGYSDFAGCYGSIYVPASLLTSYQTASNWSYFSSRFVGI